jgi:hypothetical protein
MPGHLHHTLRTIDCTLGETSRKQLQSAIRFMSGRHMSQRPIVVTHVSEGSALIKSEIYVLDVGMAHRSFAQSVVLLKGYERRASQLSGFYFDASNGLAQINVVVLDVGCCHHRAYRSFCR